MVLFFIALVLLLAFIIYAAISERCFRIESPLDHRNLPGPKGIETSLFPPSHTFFRYLTGYRHSILRTATLNTKSKILASVKD